MQFLITNNGSHPPDKWAELTANNILNLVEISEDVTDDPVLLSARSAGRRAKANLLPVLFNIFEEEFDRVQKAECKCLKDHGHEHLTSKCDPAADAAAILKRVQLALSSTPFGEHFAKPEAEDVLRRMIAQYVGNVMHIERSYHADRHPDTDEAKAFRAKHHPGE
jgi:hypothetical protein